MIDFRLNHSGEIELNDPGFGEEAHSEIMGRCYPKLREVLESEAVEAVVDSILGTITEALSSNERVDVRGFGSFVVKEKKERQGRNPRTGETITIQAKRDVGFRAGKELNEKLSKPRIS